MSHSLNDACRFRLALASNPDVVDDPKGLDHPVAHWAARLGVSPAEFSEICREFQKLRAKGVDHRVEDGGVGHGLGLKGVDAHLQSLNAPEQQIVGHFVAPLSDHRMVQAKNAGVEVSQ